MAGNGRSGGNRPFGSRVADVGCDVAMCWVSESGIGMAPLAADRSPDGEGDGWGGADLGGSSYNGWDRGLLVSWNTLAGICWEGEGGVCRVMLWMVGRGMVGGLRLKGRGISWDWVGCSCLGVGRGRTLMCILGALEERRFCRRCEDGIQV